MGIGLTRIIRMKASVKLSIYIRAIDYRVRLRVGENSLLLRPTSLVSHDMIDE